VKFVSEKVPLPPAVVMETIAAGEKPLRRIQLSMLLKNRSSLSHKCARKADRVNDPISSLRPVANSFLAKGGGKQFS
jgi:hypothetical protein